MRWRKRPYVKPILGEHREITKFLVLPKTINNETRWLEKATWKQVAVERCSNFSSNDYDVTIPEQVWDDLCWIDRPNDVIQTWSMLDRVMKDMSFDVTVGEKHVGKLKAMGCDQQADYIIELTELVRRLRQRLAEKI